MNKNAPALQVMVGKKKTSLLGSQAEGYNKFSLKSLNIATPALALGCGAGVAGGVLSSYGNPVYANYAFNTAGTSCGAGCTALATSVGYGATGYVLNKIDKRKNPQNYYQPRVITLGSVNKNLPDPY